MDEQIEMTRELLQASTRRHFFKQSAFGIGAAALGACCRRSH